MNNKTKINSTLLRNYSVKFLNAIKYRYETANNAVHLLLINLLIFFKVHWQIHALTAAVQNIKGVINGL
jgi:hypothetical protein